MPKLSEFRMGCKEYKVDDDLNRRVENMMNDPFFEFALESIEEVYNYIQLTDKVKNWMIEKLNALENYKERESGQ